MKILQIDFNLGAGGAERFVTDLSNELSKNNDVIVCTILNETSKNTFHKQFLSPKIKYINIGCKKGLCFKSVKGIINVIRREKPDVVHGHLVTPLLFIPSILLKKIRFVITLHNVADKCLSFPCEKYINKYFIFKYKKIIPVTISDICYDSYIKLYGLRNAYKIDNGRTLPTKSTLFESVKAEIQSYKRHVDDLVFIHVARFAIQKNQEVLIDVFNDLKNKHLILIILGEKFDTAGLYLKKKSSNNIFFLGAKTNVADYLLNSDFFCLTSLWEGLPISLLEAMACKVIPICTPVGGIPNVIKDGITGYLSPNCEKTSYENTVLRAINDKDKIDRHILFEEYMQRFSMKECVNKYYNVYVNG